VTPWIVYASAGVAVFSIAAYGLFIAQHPVRRIIAANLMGSGVFLVLIAIAHRSPQAVDPVPHALVLTGIVVSVCATALALALVRALSGSNPGTARRDDREPRDGAA
jgi:multicomponent Na+:H+ antiporter subunit C